MRRYGTLLLVFAALALWFAFIAWRTSDVTTSCTAQGGTVAWTGYAGPLSLSYLCIGADGRVLR